jgi:hypothetical protein
MLLILVITSLLRGPGHSPSVIGIQRCYPVDHVLFAILIVGGIVLTIIGGIVVKK